MSSLRHPGLIGLSILLAPAMWILFVTSTHSHELFVGVPACIATLVFTFYVSRFSPISVSPRARDVAQCWRLPWYILSGVGEITLVLFKDLFGIESAKDLYLVSGFDTSKHDPVRIARTVLAVAYTTASPNFIVIGIDQSQSRMLYHQISASEIPVMTKNLGAKS